MRYPVLVNTAALPCEPGRCQVVFHGINKSGSLAMAEVLREAFLFENRKDEFISHYHQGSYSVDMPALISAAPSGRGFVVGHALYGALRPVPNRIWVTQFRHPLPRTVSCYHWLKRKHEAKEGKPYVSLSEFVDRSRGISHSQVAQFGLGNGPRRTSRRKSLRVQDLLDISIDALHSNFSLIGIAEYFEESIFAFAAACGLKTVTPWVRDTRNKGRKHVSALDPAEVDLIKERYAADFELYDHALSIFREQNDRLGFDTHSLSQYQDACRDQYNDRIT